MEIFIFTVIVSAALFIYALSSAFKSRPPEFITRKKVLYKALEKIIEKYRLNPKAFDQEMKALCLDGYIDSFNLVIKDGYYINSYEFFEITLKHLVEINESFSIKNDYRGFLKRTFSTHEEVILGNANIDSKLKIIAEDKRFIFNFLNFNVRKKLSTLYKLKLPFIIDNDTISIFIPRKSVSFEKSLNVALETGLYLAEEMTSGIHIENRILNNLQIEKDKNILIKSIGLLSNKKAQDSNIKSVLQNYLQSKDKYIQIVAASKLGIEGAEHVFSMMVSLKKLSIKHKIKILPILIEQNYTEAINFLQEQFKKTTSNYYKTKLLEAFEKLYDQNTAKFLYNEINLVRNAGKDIKFKIIHTLGFCGQKHTIEDLKKFALNQKIGRIELSNRALKVAKKLQEKYGLDHGQLSISINEDKGNLSVAQNLDGKLSIKK